MERNEAGNEGLARGEPTEANEFSGSAPQPEGTQSEFARTEPIGDQGIRERAKSAISTAGDRLADVGSTAREKVGNAKDRLANALESGAEKLRERAHPGGATLAATTPEGTTATGDGRAAQVTDRVAGGMQATADWLREADIDGLKTGIERQVKDHPGRSLLIAVGLGYLIGRAFRGNQNV